MIKPEWTPFANPLGIVRLILLVDWDPIGLLGIPATLDEYDSYAQGVLDLLESGAPDILLVAHLKQIESERMEVRGNTTEQLFAVAAKLQTAYALAYEYAERREAAQSLLTSMDDES